MELSQVIVAFTFGVSFIVTLLVIAIKYPRPTPFQYTVFRIVLALAAAGVAAMIPGFIDIDVSAGTKMAIRAGGAIAVFVIAFFFNPAQLAIQDAASGGVTGGTPASNPLLDPIWDKLGPNLQDAFVLAATAARREGKDIVSTRGLFAALRRLHPERLSEFFDQLPPESLPDPVSGSLAANTNALSEIRLLSSCVQDSLDHLASKATSDDKLTSEDVFVDIAKHGRGDSVQRLRTHGVDVERINEIVRQLGWSVAVRD